MWDQTPGNPGTGGSLAVNAVAMYDDGGGSALYAGGTFTNMGGAARSRIAKWNGTTWASLGTGLSSTVNALTAFGSDLFVAGSFATAGGIAVTNIAKWNGTTWSALTGGGFNNTVNTLLVYNDGSGDALYAAGLFTTAGTGGVSANRIARWNGTTWAALTGGGFTTTVNALAAYNDGSGNGLYATGLFTTAGTGGVSANRVSKWNGTTWSALGSPTNGISSSGFSLTVFGGQLIVGGAHATAGGGAFPRISAWNGTTWSGLGAGIGSTDVRALAVFDDGAGAGAALYAGGNYSTAGSVTANNIAKWNGTTWSVMGHVTPGVASGSPPVAALIDASGLSTNGGLFVAGGFTTANTATANQIARWACLACSTPTISAQPQSITRCTNQAASFSVTPSGAGTMFYQWRKDSVNLTNTGRITGATTSTLNIATTLVAGDAGSYDCVITSPCGQVTSDPASLTVQLPATANAGADRMMYSCSAGCITLTGQATNSSLVTWTSNRAGDTFSPNANDLNASYCPGAAARSGGNAILTLTASPISPCASDATDQVIISVLDSGDGPAWDFTPGAGTGLNSTVWSLFAVNSGSNIGPALYAGGQFTTAGGTTVGNVAKWDGTTWSAMGVGTTAGGTIYCFAEKDEILYVGGSAGSGFGGTANTRDIATWDGTTWAALGTGNDSGNSGFRAMTFFDADGAGGSDSLLYAGGLINSINSVTIRKLATWDGTTWAALPGQPFGATDSVAALTVWDDGGGDALFVSGAFTSAGGITGATNVLKWNGTTVSAVGRGANDGDALAVYKSELYICGGALSTVTQTSGTNLTVVKIARWNGTSWNTVGTVPFSSANASAWGMEAFDDGTGLQLYVTHNVSPYIHRWNGTTWATVGTGLSGGAGQAFAIFDDGSGPGLFDAGLFSTAGGLGATRIAQWRGSTPATPAPIADPSNVNFGNSSSLSAPNVSESGSQIVQWYTGSCGGALVEVGNPIVVTPATTTTYFARTHNNQTGCESACGTVTVQVCITAPSISDDPDSQTICTGYPVTFTVTAGGDPAPTYQWRKNTVNIGGATASSYTIPSVVIGDAADYDVVVTNPCGNVTSDAATLTVEVTPTITAPPVGREFCPGQNVTLAVGATGGSLSYQWRKATVNISGATASSYTINNAQSSHAGSYDVVVTSGNCSITSSAAVLSEAVDGWSGLVEPSPFGTFSSAGSAAQANFREIIGFDPDGAGPQPAGIFAGGTMQNGPFSNCPSKVYPNYWTKFKFNGTTWTADPLGACSGGSSLGLRGSFCTALTWDTGGGEELYVGGGFDQPWQYSGSLLNAGGIVRYTGLDYAAGTFTTVGAGTVGLGNCNLQNSDATDSSEVTNAAKVYDLAVYDDGLGSGPQLYACGSFLRAGEQTSCSTVNIRYIAKLVGTPASGTWTKLGAGAIQLNSNTGTTETSGQTLNRARTMAVLGSNLYIGGDFVTTSPQNSAGNKIVYWNGTTYTRLGPTAGDGVTDGTVQKLMVFNNELYVGGTFTSARSGAAAVTNTNRLAKWDGAMWSSVLGGVTGSAVYAMALHDDGEGEALYIGGTFTVIGGTTASNIAKFDGTTFTALGSGVSSGNNQVRSLASFDIDGSGACLYVGGNFTIAGGTTVSRIARWRVCNVVSCDPPLVTADPAGDDVCEGEEVTFTVTATGTEPLTYQWRMDGDPISGETTDTYVIAAATLADADDYDCVVTNSCGDDTSAAATLTVQAAPTVDVGSDIDSCADAPVALSAAVGAGSGCLWTTTGDGAFDDDTSPTAEYTPGDDDLTTETVTLTLTCQPVAPCASEADDSLDVTFQAEPTADAGPDQDLCVGQVVDLVAATMDSLTSQWSTSGDGAFDDDTDPTTTYTPGTGDETAGEVTLTLTCQPVAPCVQSAVDDLTVILRGGPSISVQPANQSVVESNAAVFTVTADGVPPLSYQWLKDSTPLSDGGAVSGATTATMTIDPVLESDAGFYEVAVFDDCGVVSSDQAELTVEPATAGLVLIFDNSGRAAEDCLQPGSGTIETLVVRIGMTDATAVVLGAQFFLTYDPFLLDFVAADQGNEPFTREVYESVDEGAGELSYAVGVENEGTGTTADTTLAYLYFTVIAEDCASTSLVGFSDGSENLPPTRLAGHYDVEVSAVLGTLAAITVDASPPLLIVPADVSVHSDAGECQATFPTFAVAQAVDNCDADVTVIFSRDDGKANLLDPYEYADSPIVITWTAEDDCGNSSTDTQTIEVSNQNEVFVDVELSPTLDPVGTLQRCITFEAWDCPAGAPSVTVSTEATVSTATHVAAGVSVLIPCGVTDCLTARDMLHTLRSTAPDFTDDGAAYRATYVGNRATGGHWLVQGNLNDDRFIDILDFGSFVVRFQGNYGGAGDTDCSTPQFHVDISGDGLIFTEDFTFIQINFLKRHEDNCCGVSGLHHDADSPLAASRKAFGFAEPIRSISIADLWRMGMGELAAADLNGDGFLDEADMAAFTASATSVPNSRRAVSASTTRPSLSAPAAK